MNTPVCVHLCTHANVYAPVPLALALVRIYSDVLFLQYGRVDMTDVTPVRRMQRQADLEKQDEKRKNFSRRRAHHHDADIDYINERNRNFNKKLERFYGKYTQGLKDDLERGTAI